MTKYAPEPKTYGECKLPITPANDPDIDRNSGLRFGNFPVYELMLELILILMKPSGFYKLFVGVHIWLRFFQRNS